MLIILAVLLVFRLLGFFLKVAAGVIKIIFRILIFPVLITAAVVGIIVIMAFIIEGAIKRRTRS